MRTKIRTQQIIIDLPTETAEPWIRATLQEVFKDAEWKTTQTVDCFGAVHRHINEFATQIVSVEDPRTWCNGVDFWSGFGSSYH